MVKIRNLLGREGKHCYSHPHKGQPSSPEHPPILCACILAKETAKATDEIGRKIEAIQGDTKSAVQAIGEVSSIINQINDISNTIASAVEEQTATTTNIGRSVTDAARGVGEIANNISGVASVAQSTTKAATDTQSAAMALSNMAAELGDLVSRFKG